MSASVDLFIRSYRGDFEWLAHCLKSCELFARGFRDIHIVVPEGDGHLLKHLTKEKVHECPKYPDDYLGQQVTKLLADTYTDSDYVCHFDSDTIWTKPISPELLITEGRPIAFYEPYSKLEGCHWQPIVAETLGWIPQFEFMRRHPFVYPRWIYNELRAYLEARHRTPLANYVTSRPHKSFSEFNVLGAFAWEKFRSKFEWKDPHQEEVYVRQFWSWGGIHECLPEIEKILNTPT
jgi:hypothetical protein